MLQKYPSRTVLGLAMIISQAFLYNGVSFTFAADPGEVLRRRRRTGSGCTCCPFALGNFLGPLLLGRLFDTVGPQADDRRDLRGLGRPAGRRRATCSSAGMLDADDPDAALGA